MHIPASMINSQRSDTEIGYNSLPIHYPIMILYISPEYILTISLLKYIIITPY